MMPKPDERIVPDGKAANLPCRRRRGRSHFGMLLAGCKGIPTQDEMAARRQVRSVAEVYRPDGQKPNLPALTTSSSLGDFLIFALLNQPAVEAAYYDWTVSVERITTERSLPDPKLTFQA